MPRRILVSTLLVLVILGCTKESTASRVRSPDGLLEAVHIVSSSGGATVGAYDDVYVQAASSGNPKLTVISGYKLGCISVSWSGNRKLLVRYAPLSEGSIGAMPKDSVFKLARATPESLAVSYDPMSPASCRE